MTWVEKFDLVRHFFEFFFYLVTGPLVTVAAVKKLTQKKDPKTQLLELQKSLLRLAKDHTSIFKEGIVPFVDKLDSQLIEKDVQSIEAKKDL